ncbi:MAG: TonB family protein [Acidobacteriaceae bacterium]
MRCIFAFGLFVLTASGVAAGQQSVPAGPAPDPAQAIHFAEPGVVAPKMLYPSVIVSRSEDCNQLNGLVRLSAVVDAQGIPHDVKIVEAGDPRLDKLAATIIPAQRFQPGTYNGDPAVVAVQLTVGLQTCVPGTKRKHRDDDVTLILRSHPSVATDVQPPPPETAITTPTGNSPVPERTVADSTIYQVGGPVSVPIPVIWRDPEYTARARRQKITGTCLIGAIIGADGVPQNVHVVRSLDPELDNSTVETVKSWRFRPALKDGIHPVPVEVTVDAIFHHVEGTFVSFANMMYMPSRAVTLDDCSDSDPKCFFRPPVALNADEVEARFIPSALDHNRGMCVVAFMIDGQGIPQAVRVVRSLDPGFDDDVMDAARDLRFKPATKDGIVILSPGVFYYKFRPHSAVDKREQREELLRAAVFHILLGLM